MCDRKRARRMERARAADQAERREMAEESEEERERISSEADPLCVLASAALSLTAVLVQDVRAFTELVNSPGGGVYLYSKKANMMFVHVAPTPTDPWCDPFVPSGPKCSTANAATFDSYFGSEHQVSMLQYTAREAHLLYMPSSLAYSSLAQAGFVSGVGGYGVGKVNGQ